MNYGGKHPEWKGRRTAFLPWHTAIPTEQNFAVSRDADRFLW